jgi:hypothetical protein
LGRFGCLERLVEAGFLAPSLQDRQLFLRTSTFRWHFLVFKMSVPARHVNLTTIQAHEKHDRDRHLALAAAKSGHTAAGNPFGSKADMNFWNEYSRFHAMPKDPGLMKDIRPRKIVKKSHF